MHAAVGRYERDGRQTDTDEKSSRSINFISALSASHMPLVLAAVEGGGTSFVCAIAHDKPENIVERAEFPTTTPEETIGKCCDWLRTRKYDGSGCCLADRDSAVRHLRGALY